MKKLLLIEDDLPKQRQILQATKGVFDDRVQIEVSKSVNDAIDKLDADHFDCVLLDMSLPTFNEGESYSSGGRQQDLAGHQLMSYMDEMEIVCPVFLITQLDDFVDDDGKTVLLAELNERLKIDFPANFKGYTHFHHSSDGWSVDLKTFLLGL